MMKIEIAVVGSLLCTMMGCADEGFEDPSADGADEGIPLQVSDATPTEAAAVADEGPVDKVAQFCANGVCDPNYRKQDGWVNIVDGIYGTWWSWTWGGANQVPFEMCPAGSFAYGMEIKQEAYQGSGDDTALNGVRLYCYNRSSGAFTGTVQAGQGSFGSWTGQLIPAGITTQNPLKGMQARAEGSQGSGDDAATLVVEGRWLDGQAYWPPRFTAFDSMGTLRGYKPCPVGQAVCGIDTRIEGSQGGGDDTALNGLNLACCAF